MYILGSEQTFILLLNKSNSKYIYFTTKLHKANNLSLKDFCFWWKHWHFVNIYFIFYWDLMYFSVMQLHRAKLLSYSRSFENRISSFLILDKKGRVFFSLCYNTVKYIMFDYPPAIFNMKCLPFATSIMSPALSLAWASWKHKLITEIS